MKKSIQGDHIMRSSQETTILGEHLGETLKKGDIVLLYGKLGSGKTCFVQGMAKGMGITEQVNSPTYVYVHPYKKEPPFYHVDLYRVHDMEKLKSIGIEELLLEKNNIMAVEWPEILLMKYTSFPHRHPITVSIERKNTIRRITILT